MKSDKSENENLLESYRLVLVDDENIKDKPKENSIDFIEVIKFLWGRKMYTIKFGIIFFVIGVGYALMSQVEFSTDAKLLPQFQSSALGDGGGGAGKLLKKYGGILGLGGGLDLGGEGAIVPPQLYPDIIYSLPFQLRLLHSEVKFAELDSTVTLYEYFDEIQPNTTRSKIKRYTIGILGELIELIIGENEDEYIPLPRYDPENDNAVISLTKYQSRIVGELSKRIGIIYDELTGIVYLSIEMPDKVASSEVGLVTIELLTEYIRDYKTRKALEDLKFTEEQYEKAKNAFSETQRKLASFRDSNLGQLTARAQIKESELESDFELKFGIYNLLAQQVENSKIKLQEKTPVFRTLQPFRIPFKKSKPKRAVISIAFSIFGGFISLCVGVLQYIKENQIKLF